MKTRGKMKAWQKALMIVPVALVVCAMLAYLCIDFFAWSSPAAVYLEYLRECGHKPRAIVSAELVSQEEPIIFSSLYGEPEINGVKVRLTYEDDSSRVVKAYYAKNCAYSNRVQGRTIDPNWCLLHVRGMLFGLGWYSPYKGYPPERPPLEPGIHQIAMFCVDALYSCDDDGFNGPKFDVHNPEDAGVAYCLVEVMYVPEANQ